MPATLSDRTIGRLSLYRRLLGELSADGVRYVFSHDIARGAGLTAAQVRRDVMAVGFTGTPTRGYDVRGLADSIAALLDGAETQNVALVGIGNLGRAILAFFFGRRPSLRIVAAFDRDPQRTGRIVHGCRCYAMGEMDAIVAAERITVGIIAVPASQAQRVADELVRAGVRGILNFAPAALRVPDNVYVEQVDITASLEKVAFFARLQETAEGLRT